jgi:secreted PhoX family phosphatase
MESARVTNTLSGAAVFGQYGPEADSFKMPTGLAIDLTGAVWVVHTGNNSLAEFVVWR